MALRVEQVYVFSRKTEEVVLGLRECSRIRGRNFSPHPRYRLTGVKEVLRRLVTGKRRFLVAPPKYGWVCIWEIAGRAEFADRGLVSCLSNVLGVRTLWVALNDEYNIYAHQVFDRGILEEEMFRPEDYFLGKVEGGDYGSYGSCHSLAEDLNRRLKLPHFLLTVPAMQRRQSLTRSVRKVVANLKPV
jgi:hypothetical protein